MPRHQQPDVYRPVNDNAVRKSGQKDAVGKSSKGMPVPNDGKPSHSPQASSLPGSLPVIKDVGQRSGGIHGIPGIISSTLTSPETRQRLVSGILDPMDHGAAPAGPVHSVMGHDATAYNTGMVHIRGSRF